MEFATDLPAMSPASSASDSFTYQFTNFVSDGGRKWRRNSNVRFVATTNETLQ
jgi:hypothetical protein